MKKIYLYGFLGIIGAVVAGAAVLSLPPTVPASDLQTDSQTKEAGSHALTASEPFFDFGTISMAAGTVPHVFDIKNASQVPVTITKIYTSCMCTLATLVTSAGRVGPFGMPSHESIPNIQQTLAPNEEARVEIVFDPAAHGPQGTGKVRRIVYLETGGGPDSAFELTFEATVTP